MVRRHKFVTLCLQILLSNNETKKAESFIAKALENDSEDPTLYVYRALVYIEEGELDKTREYLGMSMKLYWWLMCSNGSIFYVRPSTETWFKMQFRLRNACRFVFQAGES